MPMLPRNIGINCHFAGIFGASGTGGISWDGTGTGMSDGPSFEGSSFEGSISGGVTGNEGAVGSTRLPGSGCDGLLGSWDGFPGVAGCGSA